MEDVIIIGAGAAGLSAARVLADRKRSVTILEARDRIGGRIFTINDGSFSFPVEAGAEFVHGELPLTKALMKEAGVSYFAGEGKTWSVLNGKLSAGDFFNVDWDVMMDRLQKLDHDMTMGRFLELHFSDSKYAELRDAVRKFVEGYDAADLGKVSALALRREWSNEDIKGYRPIGGYSRLMEFLWSQIQEQHGKLKLSTVVRKVSWRRNHVEIFTEQNERFEARNIIVTIPTSILKRGQIEFDPPLESHFKAMQDIEVGGVIKFLVEFNDRIWERRDGVHRHMPNMNFLFSDARVPTWWTQNPNHVALLTGWLAGPSLMAIDQHPETLVKQAHESLAYLTGVSVQQTGNEIRTMRVINWSADPFSLGAYAYATLKTPHAIRVLLCPAEDTIYFAGEALYEGAEMGTVEAALASGKQAARKISHESLAS